MEFLGDTDNKCPSQNYHKDLPGTYPFHMSSTGYHTAYSLPVAERTSRKAGYSTELDAGKRYTSEHLENVTNIPDITKQYNNPLSPTIPSYNSSSQVSTNVDRNHDGSTRLRPKLPPSFHTDPLSFGAWKESQRMVKVTPGHHLTTNEDESSVNKDNNVNLNELVPCSTATDQQMKSSENIPSEDESIVDCAIDAKNLVAQLEQRIFAISKRQQLLQCSDVLCKNGPSLNVDTHTTAADDVYNTAEDLEVAEFIQKLNETGNNTNHVNRRIIAALRRRAEAKQVPLETESRVKRRSVSQTPTIRKKETNRTKSQEPRQRRLTWDELHHNTTLDVGDQIPTTHIVQSARFSEAFVLPTYNPNNSYRQTVNNNVEPLYTPQHHQKSTTRLQGQRHSSNDNQSAPGDKLTAMVKLQRRKSYDPKQSIGTSASQNSARKSVPMGTLPANSVNQTKPTPGRMTTNTTNVKSRKSVESSRRSAPVKTEDCLAALNYLQVANADPMANRNANHLTSCNPLSKYANCRTKQQSPTLESKRTSGNSITSGSQIRKQNQVTAFGITPTSSGYIERKIYAGQSMTNKSTRPFTVQRRDPSVPSKSACTGLEAHRMTTTKTSCSPIICSSVHRATNLKRSNTPTDTGKNYREVQPFIPQIQTASLHTTPTSHATTWDNEKSYPDMAVESIRYKVERLANLVVGLRKRIERDFAEQGTCSPGDDVYGDEAVGATVSGVSTGMHPVVAMCLKHIRILEFNTQEIFSLLYPNEVDLWEPAKICLKEGIGDEIVFNEVQSQITDRLSARIGDMAQQHQASAKSNSLGMFTRQSNAEPPSSLIESPTPVKRATQEFESTANKH